MWPEMQELGTSSDLICELVMRVMILLTTCVMQLSFKPHMYYITEEQLLNCYKNPRHASYVPPWATVFIVIVIPVLLFIELYMTKNIVELVQSFLAWSLALSINALLTEIIKLVAGRPRPDYFYRCFPDGVMTKELRCTGELKDILEGRKSFPSGHSSFAFCSMGFLSLWLCGRLGEWRERAVATVAPLLLAAAVAVSRYCDNHHHWEDITVGSLLGLLSTYFCYNWYYYPLTSDHSGCPYVLTVLEAAGENLSPSNSCGSGHRSVSITVSFT